jgi:hypothetical protein
MKHKIYYQEESLHSYQFKKSLDDINDKFTNYRNKKDRHRDALRRMCELDDAEALAGIEAEDILEQAEDFKSKAWQ